MSRRGAQPPSPRLSNFAVLDDDRLKPVFLALFAGKIAELSMMFMIGHTYGSSCSFLSFFYGLFLLASLVIKQGKYAFCFLSPCARRNTAVGYCYSGTFIYAFPFLWSRTLVKMFVVIFLHFRSVHPVSPQRTHTLFVFNSTTLFVCFYFSFPTGWEVLLFTVPRVIIGRNSHSKGIYGSITTRGGNG